MDDRASRRRRAAPPDLLLRPATAVDADAIASIWHQGWHDAHDGHVPAELVTVRTAASFWTRAAERIPDTTVAERAGRIAGFIMINNDELEQLYVDRAARGSGVADALIIEAERLVRAQGHRQIWLAVATGNRVARRFYERVGWTDAGPFDYPASAGAQTIPVPCHRYVCDLV